MYVKTLTVRRADRMYRCLSLVDAHREGGKVRHELVCRIGEADDRRASWTGPSPRGAVMRRETGLRLESSPPRRCAELSSHHRRTLITSPVSRSISTSRLSAMAAGPRASPTPSWR
jgi:hypothetical protein